MPTRRKDDIVPDDTDTTEADATTDAPPEVDDEGRSTDEAGSESDHETDSAATELDDAADDSGNNGDGDDEPETFPREYVAELRQENARYRERARTAEHYAQRLHGALVAATGRLQDPSDLPFDEAHLDDPDALNAAIDELLERKPHLKSRRVVGDVGQGAGGVKPGDVDLAAMLRARA
ncbi:hypothetical protein [Mycolicibacterium austroafricanum]|uniref:hypothetical protein n=1 Tax=Mycolicibacterium austroafricanum TaxID=39687 RepID=UPI001CA364D8|nr:hypothetical protein [Mycolicibacterium austroafricanum]QZT60929.1 hypothetical protein JN085_18160 [Mycolicibacterium austroafricanum]